jgi:hypothetical protein
LKGKFEKFIPLLLLGLGVGSLYLGLIPWLFPTERQVSEIPVKVIETEQAGKGMWFVPRDAVAQKSLNPFVARLKQLRAKRLAVRIADETENRLLLQSNDLKSGDLLVMRPDVIPEDERVIPIAGLDEEQLILMSLETGMAAGMAEDLDETVRFISPHYSDDLGFNLHLLRQLLKRAYKEFDEPHIELTEPPEIQVEGNQAVVQARVKLNALYQGRRNYLLGDETTANQILLQMEKSTYGWKVSEAKGVKPLGFNEKFLRLLGAEIGLSLTEVEQKEKKKACMPCRRRMTERFGSLSSR